LAMQALVLLCIVQFRTICFAAFRLGVSWVNLRQLHIYELQI
jgi:hypothetical protein